jgi:DNA polymerase zeta
VVKGPVVDPQRLRTQQLEIFDSEVDLINFMIDEVQDLNPDILVGWEVHSASWGYLLARAKFYGVSRSAII